MDNKNRNVIIGIIVGNIILISGYLFYSSWKNRPGEVDSGKRPVMGTFARVYVIAQGGGLSKRCMDTALARIYEVDNLMSDYKDDSEISEINKYGFERPVAVSPSTYNLIKKAIKFSEVTGGAFDITLGPLVDLWHEAAEAGSVPTDEELERAKAKVGYKKIILNDADYSVGFEVEGMRLDLGGIAKGYAVDFAIEAIIQAGAEGAMVDIGGEIRCFGKGPDGKAEWAIGVQNPNLQDRRSEIIIKLVLGDKAVATSGDYQQFVTIGGKRYSHIINERTGSGAEGLSSVSIITEQAADADALATAVSVIGEEAGLALIERIPETEAIIVSSAPDYKITKSSGADKYIKNSK